MLPGPKRKLYNIVLEFPSGNTKTVKITATSQSVAENRAMKFNPNAVGVKRNAEGSR